MEIKYQIFFIFFIIIKNEKYHNIISFQNIKYKYIFLLKIYFRYSHALKYTLENIK